MSRDDDLEVLVSSAIGQATDGSLFPVVALTIPGVLKATVIPPDKATDIAFSLLEGAIRASADLAVVTELRKRGASREECQVFLDAMKAQSL